MVPRSLMLSTKNLNARFESSKEVLIYLLQQWCCMIGAVSQQDSAVSAWQAKVGEYRHVANLTVDRRVGIRK